MKLILTQEVDALGAPGDIVEVKDGYGRNFLVPRGLAIRWTRGSEKQIDSIKKAREVRNVRDVSHAEELRDQLEELNVTLRARAGDTGRLFGAITPADIAAAVRASGGPEIDKRRVQVDSPIKTLGAHLVHVKIHDDVAATVHLDVLPA
jgi:large subunit ribosomal protein L9